MTMDQHVVTRERLEKGLARTRLGMFIRSFQFLWPKLCVSKWTDADVSMRALVSPGTNTDWDMQTRKRQRLRTLRKYLAWLDKLEM